MRLSSWMEQYYQGLLLPCFAVHGSLAKASFLVEIHLACEATSMDQGSDAIKLLINDLYSREVCLYTHNNDYITRWYITASFPGLELVGKAWERG